MLLVGEMTAVDTRRDFLKKAALLSGAAGAWSVLPDSIARALAIEAEAGSTFLDAEHVVILMQENRSFDHCFGTLQGVRGFNDPRATRLANGNPVWLQSNAAGETYAPFRLNIKETNATWMGSLPHSWANQQDARNQGRHDRWLDAKRSSNPFFSGMPLTLGYYSREDVPFYYALADAFTICDQHFCSSLTGTTPNRLYLWTGTIREKQEASSPANVRNEEVDYGAPAHWTTFPERLEEAGVAWKVYQNEISAGTGLRGEEDAWLANFTDNPLEWFVQYRVGFAEGRHAFRVKRLEELTRELADLERRLAAAPGDPDGLRKRADELGAEAKKLQAEHDLYHRNGFGKLPARAQSLHNRAFTTNRGDPAYRRLAPLTYRDGEKERTVQAPAGDILHQFRQDVRTGQLPTVSWLVAPENFSDHPGAAWYGAWYVSEVLDILTQNPEVWKKTIFLLTYDENDGYFDHVPPFTAPHPERPESGRVSAGIDTGVEYVTLEQDRKRKPAREAREGPIGLGYRVPLVIASPWSRGGCVCSQVFDHTSVLQLLERLLTHKTGREVRETNISRWRRTVCGDLTSAFQAQRAKPAAAPHTPARDAFIQQIHQARFRKLPDGFRKLSAEEIEAARRDPAAAAVLPRQEVGIRRACPLPYQLLADGSLDADRKRVTLRLAADDRLFGKKSAGAPFNVFAYGGPEGVRVRAYAVAAGDSLTDSWELSEFPGGAYHLEVQGPNGFWRELRGKADAAAVEATLRHLRSGKSGAVEVVLVNREPHPVSVRVGDGYREVERTRELAPGETVLRVETGRTHGWYDVSVSGEGFARRWAGHVDTGRWSFTDPLMGKAPTH